MESFFLETEATKRHRDGTDVGGPSRLSGSLHNEPRTWLANE